MQVTTKDVEKRRQALHKISTREAECAKGVIQIQPPISGVNFSSNMSIPQARVNMNQTEYDTTFETS